jgi:hypothetical protein
MQSSDPVQDAVSIVELKNLARSMLPSSSALRGIIMSEPDCLPREEVEIKVRVYSKLLYRDESKVVTQSRGGAEPGPANWPS